MPTFLSSRPFSLSLRPVIYVSDANVNHAPRSRGAAAAAEEYNHVLISGYHDGGEGEGGGDERDGARIVLRVGKCEGEENPAVQMRK